MPFNTATSDTITNWSPGVERIVHGVHGALKPGCWLEGKLLIRIAGILQAHQRRELSTEASTRNAQSPAS